MHPQYAPFLILFSSLFHLSFFLVVSSLSLSLSLSLLRVVSASAVSPCTFSRRRGHRCPSSRVSVSTTSDRRLRELRGEDAPGTTLRPRRSGTPRVGHTEPCSGHGGRVTRVIRGKCLRSHQISSDLRAIFISLPIFPSFQSLSNLFLSFSLSLSFESR